MEKAIKTMKAAWLFPDILFLHGERGNIMALKRMASLAGIELEVERIDFNSSDFDPMEYGIIFCPPGEIASFGTVIDKLKPYCGKFREFIESGRVLIAVGTGICIFGKDTRREDKSIIDGLGLIDCNFEERKYVYGDDIYFNENYSGVNEECFGVQIQMIDVISQEEKPFGKLLYGFGNTGKDRNEGVIKNNSIFTNVLGPLLVLNPWLTKTIVKKASESVGIKFNEFDIDMSLERKSLESKKEFVYGKKTRLTNCI